MSVRLCIIAARGGSKRLPGKNLLPFCGKPLIAHTVEQAVESGVFRDVVVSSDDDGILATAMEYGAGLEIKRPPELATDEASSLDMMIHAIKYSERVREVVYDSVTLLQVTSPLRLPEDIKAAMAEFEREPAGSVVSVNAESGKFNGSIYIWDRDLFVAGPKHLYDNSRLFPMPAVRSVDIDYKDDFDRAETLMRSGEYSSN